MGNSVGRSLGDLGEQVALEADVTPTVAEATAIAEEALETDANPFTKIRFSWRPEDRAILERCRIAADEITAEGFTEFFRSLDHLYEQLRIPEQRNGIVVTDEMGRVVWQKDSRGQIIESWDQLTGQDIEYTLTCLHRIRLVVAPQVAQLRLEAHFAQRGASDVFDDAYGEVMVGTVGDRNARANRESRVERYHSFFRAYLYETTKVLLDEIDAFLTHLRNVRYWQVQSQKG